MPPAFQDGCAGMDEGEHHDAVGDRPVQLLEPLLSPESVERRHPSGERCRCQKRHQHEHHDRGERIVAEIALLVSTDDPA